MNIRKYLTAAAIAGAGLMATAPAHALLSFDFTGDDADLPINPMTPAGGGFDRFDFGSEHVGTAANPLVFEKGGITLTVRAFADLDPSDGIDRVESESILDDSPGNGGLGVVSEGSASLEQTNTGNAELLSLVFTDTLTGFLIDVTLRNLEFNNGAHDDCPTAASAPEGGCGGMNLGVTDTTSTLVVANRQFDFSLVADIPNTGDPVAETDLDGNGILASLGGGATGHTFTLAARPDATVAPQAWYLGAFDVGSVPAPATLLLFGMSLLGLGMGLRGRTRRGA